MRRKWIFIVPAAILGMALLAFLGGVIVQNLWNWILPPLFGWRELTFWQALGLLVLSRILFGGSGWRGSSGSARSRIRRRMEERCRNMTPEERERFRQRMRERWGFDPSAPETEGPSSPAGSARPE
jgi:hypothetical protein